MPGSTILEVPQHEQDWMRAELRRARYGYLLALARPAAVRRRADADRDRYGFVLLALQRVPHCERLHGSSARHPGRPAAPQGGVAVAVAVPQPHGLAEEGAVGLRVVPHAVELRDAGGATPAPAGPCRVGLDHAALAAPVGLGLEAGPVGRARRRPAADREAGPYPAHLGNPGKRAILLFADELDLHLLPKVGYQWMPQGADGQAGDAGAEPETLSGWGAGVEDWPEGALRGLP